MRIHVTRRRVLGAVVALGLAMVVAQGAVALFGAPAHAEEGAVAAIETQPRGFVRQSGRGGPGAGGLLPLRRLDLSEAQRTEIDGVRDAAREASAATRDQLREVRQALNAAVRSDVVDEGRIRSLAATLASLEADQVVREAYAYADVWQILTPEQQELVQSMAERRVEQRERQVERFRNRRNR